MTYCDEFKDKDDETTNGSMSRIDRVKEVSDFGANPGNLKMFQYIPPGIPADTKVPLLVALHGCDMDALSYLNAGWLQMADEYKFSIVAPEQKIENDFYEIGCFNFYKPEDFARDQGETKSVKSMIDHMVTLDSIDESKVFVTGFSAGGIFSATLYANYPDIINGMGVVSGGPYHCATDLISASTCNLVGVNKSPTTWGDYVRNASDFSELIEGDKVIIFHGKGDGWIVYMNAEELQQQWENVGADVYLETFSSGEHLFPIDTLSGCGEPFDRTEDIGRCIVREIVLYLGMD